MQGEKIIIISSEDASFNERLELLLKRNKYRCVFVPKNGNEVCKSIYKENPDIVLMDMFMPHLDAIGVLSSIRNDLSFSILPIYMIMSNSNPPTIEKELFSIGASYLFLRPIDIELLVNRIIQLSNYEKDKNIPIEHDLTNDVVSNILDDIGVPRHIKGFSYLRDSIALTISEPSIINSVTKQLYPTIAKKNNTTASRVERAIRHAVEVAWDRGDKEYLSNCFGYSPNKNYGRPTNSEFISILSDAVRYLKAK